jgi:hypothetical protein
MIDLAFALAPLAPPGPAVPATVATAFVGESAPSTGAWGSNNPAVLNKPTRRASRRVIGRFNVMPNASVVDNLLCEFCGARII